MRSDVDLSSQEWSTLLRLIYTHPWLFVRSGREAKLFLYLIGRTLWFHKFEERYAPRYVLRGRLAMLALPLGVAPTHLRLAKRRLEKAGLFFFEKAGSAGWQDPWICRVNAPGIVKALRAVVSRMLEYDCAAQYALDQLSSIQKKVDFLWIQEGWEERRVRMVDEERKKVEDMMEVAREQSAASRQKRKVTRDRAEPDQVRPGYILEYMQDSCAELGIKHSEPMTTAKDRAILGRSAKNFVAYCKAADVHPKELIHDVCRKWYVFRAGQLKRPDGSEIMLPEAVSFTNFFRYREPIVDWLAIHKDDAPRHKVDIVYLDDHRKEEHG
jgi:hypothetical protein